MRTLRSLTTLLFGALNFLIAVGLAGCSRQDEVTLFVAASMADVAQAWQSAYAEGGGRMVFHSGGSMILAQQIVAGANADVFLSAGRTPAERLHAEGMIAREDSAYVVNRIVLVVRAGLTPPAAIAELRDSRFDRVALADPASAPAGAYARAGLEYAGLWDIISGRMIFTADVRTTLLAVASGAADAGFVYATDAATTPDLAIFDPGFKPAHYALVMIAPETAARRACWDFLHSGPAREILAAHGFGS